MKLMRMRTIRKTHSFLSRPLIFFLLLGFFLTNCSTINELDSGPPPSTPSGSSAENASAHACPLTEPVWVKPPDDSAVQGSPEFGYYFVNGDRSIWASAWWTGQEENHLRVSEEGIKVGWFRPAGAALVITGQRTDAQAPPLETDIPNYYPTRFQATGLNFPTEGCWKVTAKAAKSELSFVVWVQPK